MNHVLITIDVEDWFQVENFKKYIPFSSWASCESRVERNTHLLLDLLDSVFRQSQQPNTGTPRSRSEAPKATFFILGWLAKRMPRLVREIHARGHEVASHGYFHNLCSHGSPADLRRDLIDSRYLLEDIAGIPIHGYRAPSFSIDDGVLRLIKDCGYSYDSSFNSFGMNSRYGSIELSRDTRMGIAYRMGDAFFELPISNIELGSRVVPLGGGGYFRLIPFRLFVFGVRSILRRRNAYLFYVHPWEVDAAQPRVNSASSFFKARHYLHLGKTLNKLALFIREFEECSFVTCREYLDRMIPNVRHDLESTAL